MLFVFRLLGGCYCFLCQSTAPAEFSTYVHTLSLHYALPICSVGRAVGPVGAFTILAAQPGRCLCAGLDAAGLRPEPLAPDDLRMPEPAGVSVGDRKSTRLNSSH